MSSLRETVFVATTTKTPRCTRARRGGRQVADPMSASGPLRAIFTDADLHCFQKSEAYSQLLSFVRLCNESVRGRRVCDVDEPVCGPIVRLEAILDELAGWVDEIPPIDQVPRAHVCVHLGAREQIHWEHACGSSRRLVLASLVEIVSLASRTFL